MKLIRFTERQSPYQVGERAAFEDALADAYIAKGVAELADQSQASQPAPEPEPEPEPRMAAKSGRKPWRR